VDFLQRVWNAIPGEDMPQKVGLIAAILGIIAFNAVMIAFVVFAERRSKALRRNEPKKRDVENMERLKRIEDILIGRARAQSAFLPGGEQPGAKQAAAIIEQDIGAAISALAKAGKIEAAEAAERGDTKAADDALAAEIEKNQPAGPGAAGLDPEDMEGLFSLAQLQIRAGYRIASKQSPERLIALGNGSGEQQSHWDHFLPADVEPALEDRNAASERHERAQTLVHDLIQRDPNNARGQPDPSAMDDTGAAREDRDGGMQALSEGLEIAKKLAARDPDNAEWQRDLAVSYNSIGDISAARGDRDGALKAYSEGLEIGKKLAARDPNNAEWQRDLSVSYDRIGDISAERGDRDAAIEDYSNGLEIRQKLCERDPSNAIWQTDLAVSAWKLAAAGARDGRRRLSDGLAILKRLDAEGKLAADQKEWISMFEAALRQAEEPAYSS
jgi:tetratricopeptide (TPR) repeat protein